MNVPRSALAACVINTLPNAQDYVHKHRDRLMEEKRQKLLSLGAARQEPHNTVVSSGVVVRNNLINHALQRQYLQQHDPLDIEAMDDDDDRNNEDAVQMVVGMQFDIDADDDDGTTSQSDNDNATL